MKRVLCVVSSLNAGGAETFLMKVFRTTDKSKYVFDFVVSADGIYEEEVLQLGGKVYKVPLRTKNPVKVFNEIKKIVKENNYKYFFKLADTPTGGILDVLAAKFGGAKWISVRSCNASTNSSPLKEAINAFLRPIFNLLVQCKIAPSDLAAAYTFGQREIDKNNVHFINNGVDLDIFKYEGTNRKEIRSEFNVPEDANLIGHVGRFTHQKNHEFLLKIFEEIYKKNNNSFLLLVGIGELQEHIHGIVESLECKNNVIFAGLRRDVPKILSALDLFLLPSFYEGMPNVVIESQATGLPCLISNTITREANITNLVTYVSLNENPCIWADEALKLCELERKDTKNDFIQHAYDIQTVANTLITLLFQEF